jgi:hypothetical protein
MNMVVIPPVVVEVQQVQIQAVVAHQLRVLTVVQVLVHRAAEAAEQPKALKMHRHSGATVVLVAL